MFVFGFSLPHTLQNGHSCGLVVSRYDYKFRLKYAYKYWGSDFSLRFLFPDGGFCSRRTFFTIAYPVLQFI